MGETSLENYCFGFFGCKKSPKIGFDLGLIEVLLRVKA